MASVVVLYEGHRKVVKIAANTLIQDIIQEAATFFQVDPSKCQLRYRKATVLSSQLFRFANIPTNATVDLVLGQKVMPVQQQISKIAFSIQDSNNSIIKSINSSATLLEVLNTLIDEGHLISQALSCDVEVIVMRNSYSGDALNTNTLASIGLAGQSGRVAIKFNSSKIPISSSGHDGSATTSSSKDDKQNTEISSALISLQEEDNNATTTNDFATPVAMKVDLTDDETTTLQPSNYDAHLSVSQVAQESKLHTVSTATSVSTGETHLPTSKTALNVPPAQSAQIVQLPHPDTVLELMHSENFDRVTIPCVTTLAKYISNIVSDPTEPKYRYINLANKVFQEKVVPTKYASDYLASIGFVTTPVDHKGIANPSLIYYPNKTVAVLIQQRIKLDELMARLNVPEEDRPKMKLKPQSQQTDSTSSSSVASLTSFDPYKVNITRTAQQPPREAMSITERKLEGLLRRREALEGPVEGLARLTEVILPLHDGSVKAMQQYVLDEGKSLQEASESSLSVMAHSVSSALASAFPLSKPTQEDKEYSNDDSRLISANLLNTLKKSSQIEETPLTTAALKSLQALEREKIYTRILLRIRFPDGAFLQGYFHPRHCVADVYEWVVDSLAPALRNAVIQSRRPHSHQRVGPAYKFELYVTPPRRVLPCESEHTLSELHLAPAALINLSWVDVDPADSLIDETFTDSDSTKKLKPAIGFYFTDELIGKADSKDVAKVDRDIYGKITYPVGHDLVPKISERKVDPGDVGGHLKTSFTSNQSHDSDMSADDKRSKSKMPKWFKVGK